jgi:hypothetical protein
VRPIDSFDDSLTFTGLLAGSARRTTSGSSTGALAEPATVFAKSNSKDEDRDSLPS